MNKLLVSLIAAPVFMFVAASPASAQSRTFVSGVGDDLFPCSRTAPCKTFAGALGKTSPQGEINCLDPGGYGAVTITKSITIDCGWTHGSIVSVGGNGITVNGAGIIVTLRGLSIDGVGTTVGNGVRIVNAAAVNIDDLVIENFLGNTTHGRGVVIDSAVNVAVTIQNTRIYNVNFIGIHSNPTGGFVTLAIDDTQIARAGTGMQFRQLTQAVVNNTSSTNNSGAGFATELGNVSTSITNSNLSNNATGIINGNGGAPTTRLYATVITGNTANGLQINTGQVISLGNNMIQGNAGGQTPSSTITTQ